MSSAASSSSSSASSRVRVAVRIRPHLARCDGADPALAALASSATVVAVRGPEREKAFEFDHVLDGSGQEQLYRAVGAPMLAEAMKGFNVCLFAYGATSSG
ncbi:MAG: hypothetical protein KC492_15640, partial [Myxococcales bacterium]|nr:hypothetical protein [Myxococcales bacterium]